MLLLILTLLVCVLLAIRWRKQLGLLAASLAALCRFLWLVPLLTTLFPQTIVSEQPDSFKQQTVHVFVDDSDSMKKGKALSQAQQTLKYLRQRCKSCDIRVTYLSKQSQDSSYTRLSLLLPDWYAQLAPNDAWLLFTDGGDFQPYLDWKLVLPHAGKNIVTTDSRLPSVSKRKGMIIGVPPQAGKNIWVADLRLPPFAFADSSIDVEVEVGQQGLEGKQQVQVQVLDADNKILTSKNITLQQDRTKVFLSVPPHKKGTHIFTAKLLPLADETNVWDNSNQKALEILPNTTGVLHLLGSPSWDGSFLRRYLKSEPKYDLISFFILRDPWDVSHAGTRELSLIPFPVDQLFGSELKNFKVIIMQNFALHRFLSPKHQHNLVEFVRAGGGLLFIGGPRALSKEDHTHSPLAKILPFKVMQTNAAYQSDKRFKIKMAKPTQAQRELASIYDDWLELEDQLVQFDAAQGLHIINPDAKQSTPLLYATDENKRELPLALASYPKHGRAIWLFSDSLWRFAMGSSSRHNYHEFLQSAMAWLLHQDLYQPLVSKNFIMYHDHQLNLVWQLDLTGAATKYFSSTAAWQVELCGKKLDWNAIEVEHTGMQRIHLRGKIAVAQALHKCVITVYGTNKAFGSLITKSVAVVPTLLSDDELGDTTMKLTTLARHLDVPLLTDPQAVRSEISLALRSWLEEEKVITEDKEEHYWLLSKWYFYLFLLFLPLEVCLRRKVFGFL